MYYMIYMMSDYEIFIEGYSYESKGQAYFKLPKIVAFLNTDLNKMFYLTKRKLCLVLLKKVQQEKVMQIKI